MFKLKTILIADRTLLSCQKSEDHRRVVTVPFTAYLLEEILPNLSATSPAGVVVQMSQRNEINNSLL